MHKWLTIMILWQGISPFTKRKIVTVATGTNRPSKNVKTGEMIQIYILPEESLSLQKNDDVCGNCPLSGKICYVNLGQAVNNIFNHLGSYTIPIWKEIKATFSGKAIRWGAYGEPVLMPLSLIKKINKIAKGYTGYTHQFENPKYQKYKQVFMASVENLEGKKTANKLGWKTYRIVESVEDLLPDEILCPASEAYKEKFGFIMKGDEKVYNKNPTCEKCLLCCGTSSRTPKNIAIVAHGSRPKISHLKRMFANDR